MTASAALAAITATDRGTGTDNTSGTTLVINGSTMNGNMTAGNCGILYIAIDNAGGAVSSWTVATGGSYTDSVGNVWYLRNQGTGGTANTSVEYGILVSNLTANFTTSSTLTVTFSPAVTAKAWTWTEASSNLPSGTVMYVFGQSTGAVNTASPSISTVQHAAAGELLIGCGQAQNPDIWVAGGDTDTTNGTWSSPQHTGVGVGAAGMSIITQAKILTAFSSQSYDPTLSSSVVSKPAFAYFAEADLRTRAIGTNNTSDTSTVMTVQLPMAAGSIGVLALSADNMGTGGAVGNFPATISDTKSNTWTLRQNGVADPSTAAFGVEMGIYTGAITTPLVIGDTLTATYVTAAVTAKTWVIYEYAPSGAGAMSYVTGGLGTAAFAASSFSLTTSSIANNDHVLGMTGTEGSAATTGDTSSTNGIWRAQTSRVGGTGGGNASVTVALQSKQVTATATQTYSVTIASASDLNGAWIEINDSSVVAGPTAAKIPAIPTVR